MSSTNKAAVEAAWQAYSSHLYPGGGDFHEAMRLAILAAQPHMVPAETDGEAEPVMWRVRGYRGGWVIVDGPPPDGYEADGGDPLYTLEALRSSVAAARQEGIEAAAEIADVVADERDVMALSSDESHFAAYREGERTAKQIAATIRSLSPAPEKTVKP